MNVEASRPIEFDRYAANYDKALNQGLSATGEDRDYFARGRLLHLKRCIHGLDAHVTSVLDFGCGTGAAATAIHDCLPALQQLIGVDVSAASIEEARCKYGELAQFATLESRPPQADCDLVYCSGVFHHIPLRERMAAMAYVVDSLRPNGLFALFENNPANPGTRYVMSRIPFDRDAILVWPNEARRLCRSAGLTVLQTSYLFFFPRLLAALRPVESLLARVPLGGQYLVLARKQ